MEIKNFKISDFRKELTKEETTDVVVSFSDNVMSFQVRNGGNQDMGELTGFYKSPELESFIEKLLNLEKGYIDKYIKEGDVLTLDQERVNENGVRFAVSVDYMKVVFVYRILDRELYLKAWDNLS